MDFLRRRRILFDEGYDYSSSTFFYSLRRPMMTTLWTNSVLQLRRSSDNQNAWVFFDGGAAGKTITLNSLISLTDQSTPDSPAVTLGTWVGANDAFVEIWNKMASDNVWRVMDNLLNNTDGNQPQFISSGTIITKNGLPAIDFLSSTRSLSRASAGAWAFLDSGNDFTIISLSNSRINTDAQAIISTKANSTGGTDKFTMFNDRSAAKNLARIRASSTSYNVLLTAQQDSSNQRLLTSVVDGTAKDIEAYFNGTSQGTTTWFNSYVNDIFQVGVQLGTVTPLDGKMQEIIGYASKETSNLTDIHADIDTYYPIP